MISWLTNSLLKLRWLLFALSLLAIVIAGKGLGKLQFSVDYHAFFSHDNPELLAYEELISTYTNTDNLFLIVSPKEGDIFSAENLTAIAEITEKSWQLPYSIRVDSVSNFQHTEAVGDDLDVYPLLDDVTELNQERIQLIREVTLNEPSLLSRLINHEGTTTGINVTFQLPGKSLTEIPEIASSVRELVRQMEEKYQQIDIRLSGIIMMNNAYGESSKGDIKTLIPLMLLVVYIVLSFMLRSILLTLTSVLITMMSVTTAMGVAGWSGISLTTVSVVAPTIIMTIVVGICVHLLLAFQAALDDGESTIDALATSIGTNFVPVFVTSFTTALGFFAMNSSDVPPFNDLGNIVGFGVVASFVFSLCTLPAVVSVIPIRFSRRKSKRDLRHMTFLANFVITHRNTLLWVIGVAVIALASLLPLNITNEKFVEQFDESLEFRQDSDFLIENLTGVYRIDVSLNTGEENGIYNPNFLNNLEAYANWLRDMEEVRYVGTITDTLKRINKNLHGGDDNYYSIPQDRELAAQDLLLYELSLPYGLDLNNLISLDKSSTRLVVIFEDLKTERLLEINELLLQTWQSRYESASVSTASTMLMFSNITFHAVESMVKGTFVVFAVISVLLTIMLRSIKIGIVSLLPNIVPAAVALGLWGLFVGEVGMSISIVLAMTFGIVVDDTVHFLSKYLRARKTRNMNAEEAVRYAFEHVGNAMVVTSIVLMSGFMVLSLSLFSRNADMGVLASVTILVALVVDLLWLPPILMRLEEKTGNSVVHQERLGEA